MKFKRNKNDFYMGFSQVKIRICSFQLWRELWTYLHNIFDNIQCKKYKIHLNFSLCYWREQSKEAENNRLAYCRCCQTLNFRESPLEIIDHNWIESLQALTSERFYHRANLTVHLSLCVTTKTTIQLERPCICGYLENLIFLMNNLT